MKSHVVNVMLLGCFNHHGYLATSFFEDPVYDEPRTQIEAAKNMGFGCMARIIQYGLGFFSFSYKDIIEADRKVGRNSTVPNDTTSYIKLLNDHKDKGTLPDHKIIKILLEKSIVTLSTEDFKFLQCLLQDIWCLQNAADFPDYFERNPKQDKVKGPFGSGIRSWRDYDNDSDPPEDAQTSQPTDKDLFASAFLSKMSHTAKTTSSRNEQAQEDDDNFNHTDISESSSSSHRRHSILNQTHKVTCFKKRLLGLFKNTLLLKNSKGQGQATKLGTTPVSTNSSSQKKFAADLPYYSPAPSTNQPRTREAGTPTIPTASFVHTPQFRMLTPNNSTKRKRQENKSAERTTNSKETTQRKQSSSASSNTKNATPKQLSSGTSQNDSNNVDDDSNEESDI